MEPFRLEPPKASDCKCCPISKEDLLALARAENRLTEVIGEFDCIAERLSGDAHNFLATIAGMLEGIVSIIDEEMGWESDDEEDCE